MSKSTKLGRMLPGYIRYNFRRGANTTEPRGGGERQFCHRVAKHVFGFMMEYNNKKRFKQFNSFKMKATNGQGLVMF